MRQSILEGAIFGFLEYKSIGVPNFKKFPQAIVKILNVKVAL